MNLPGEKTDMQNKKQFLGLLYGLTAGLAYACVLWGIDAYQFFQSHLAYPWASFIPGLAIALLLGGVCGWITIRTENAIVGAVSWLLMGLVIAWLGIWLPLKFTPQFIVSQEPVLRGWLVYPVYENESAILGIVMLITGVPALILGALENNLVEQAFFSTASGAILIPMFFVAVFIGVASLGADAMLNTPYRNSVSALDNLFDFAIANQGKEVDPVLARSKHLGAVSGIGELLNNPRRLFIFYYSETADEIRVLVDFQTDWVLCFVIAEQPSYCKIVEPPN
jgi:hypothetical protein